MLYTHPLGAMRVLGLDVGSKTIGIAVADPTGLIASPHSVLARRGHTADAAAVTALARETSASAIVVGLPLELDGTEGHRARLVQAFVAVLTSTLAAVVPPLDPPVKIHRWDERFSTSAAERTLLEADVSRARRRRVVDALAAQFILQGWLEAQRIAAARASEGHA